jgi:hypothetical protein
MVFLQFSEWDFGFDFASCNQILAFQWLVMCSIGEQSCPQFPTFFFSKLCDIWHSMHFLFIELL